MEEKIIRKGWARPASSKKFHYFNDSIIALCGRWAFAPDDSEAYEDSHDDHADNCAACKRKIKRTVHPIRK